MLFPAIVLIKDNARPHIAAVTQEFISQFRREMFSHMVYSRNLTSSDFHLGDAMEIYLITLPKTFNEGGIRKLTHRYEKCLSLHVGFAKSTLIVLDSG